MNVIAGNAGSLRLISPKGISTRPTGAKIKESLFSIIADDLYDADFLDLFAGSGAIGIEALSRGAKSAVFVDFSRESIDAVSKNLKFTKLYDKAQIIKSDVIRAVCSMKRKFDIIFIDPPYSKGLTQKTLRALYDKKILKNSGFLIAEQALEEEEPDIDGIEIFKIKKYRVCKITFMRFKYKGEEQ